MLSVLDIITQTDHVYIKIDNPFSLAKNLHYIQFEGVTMYSSLFYLH